MSPELEEKHGGKLLEVLLTGKLAVGHLTIFVTRTRGPFWSTIVIKVLATLAAVYGWFMVPIGWKWAGLIWGYALVWFLVNDRIKLAAYRILDLGQSVLVGASAHFNGPAAARQRPHSHA